MKFFYMLREFALAIALMVLLPMFAYWSAQVVLDKPVENLADASINASRNKSYEFSDKINKLGVVEQDLMIKSNDESAKQRLVEIRKEIDELKLQKTAIDKEIEEKYKKEREHLNFEYAKRARMLFYFSATIGLLALVFGAFTRIPSMGAGAIMGAIACLGSGYFFSWDQMTSIVKLVSLAIGLLLVVGTGYYLYTKDRS